MTGTGKQIQRLAAGKAPLMPALFRAILIVPQGYADRVFTGTKRFDAPTAFAFPLHKRSAVDELYDAASAAAFPSNLIPVAALCGFFNHVPHAERFSRQFGFIGFRKFLNRSAAAASTPTVVQSVRNDILFYATDASCAPEVFTELAKDGPVAVNLGWAHL